MASRESILENCVIELAILMTAELRDRYKQSDKRDINNKIRDISICLENIDKNKVKTIMTDLRKIKMEVNKHDK